MFSSTNENTGFSAIEQKELEKVNGGIPALLIGGAAIIVGTIIAVNTNPPRK